MSPESQRGFLALGDSYTIGEGVADSDRWPNQLAAALGDAGIDIDVPQVVATTGWTTDELGLAIDAANPASDHALVTLLIGVNNQYRGRSIENYAMEFGGLLKRAVTFAGGNHKHVIVVSIPDWGVTAFARDCRRDTNLIANEIDAFNATAQSITASKNVAFVDITDLTRTHPDEVVDDGLHPNAAQYARWVERLGAVARVALRDASLY
ncbi:MAG: SGNH/GDSL hydrolase family protein [Dokdonella sp.]